MTLLFNGCEISYAVENNVWGLTDFFTMVFSWQWHPTRKYFGSNS